MACAGITVWGGLVNAGLKAGETVALVGAGGGLGRKSSPEVTVSPIFIVFSSIRQVMTLDHKMYCNPQVDFCSQLHF